MIDEKHVQITIYLSLFVQILTSLLSYDGLKYKLKEKDEVLKDVLRLELIVQLIEAIFYIWVIFALRDLNKMTPRRYIDWVITTPTMLISTIIFMKYQEHKEKNDGTTINFKDFLKDNKQNIYRIIFLNALMLLFGYLGETNKIDKNKSIFIGFIFFFLSFRLIYEEYGKKSILGKKLFQFLVFIWGLYGVTATFGNINKNISYNMLDVVSKNFYGLFIYYKIKEQNKLQYKDKYITQD